MPEYSSIGSLEKKRWPGRVLKGVGYANLFFVIIGALFWLGSFVGIFSRTAGEAKLDPPYFTEVFYLMMGINLIFLIVLWLVGKQLTKRSWKAVSWCSFIFLCEIFYLLIEFTVGSYWNAIDRGVGAATGVGNMGLAPQLITAYPIFGLLLLSLARWKKTPQDEIVQTTDYSTTSSERNDIEYGGFWRRFLALSIDSLIMAPIVFLVHLMSWSRTAALFWVLPQFLFFLFYHVYLNARFGQTPGKMIARVKIVRLDRTPIAWKEALLRGSVDVLFRVIFTIGCVMALWTMTDIYYTDLQHVISLRNVFSVLSDLPNMEKFVSDMQPIAKATVNLMPLPTWVSQIYNYWVWGELIVLLTNKKRRALHDFIAGTVVVRC